MVDVTTIIGKSVFKNPVFNASGTFNYKGMKQVINPGLLGAIITKSFSLTPWMGNNEPRILEFMPHGMLNSIGIQNTGVHSFLETDLPVLNGFQTNIVPSIAGKSVDEYVQIAQVLDQHKEFLTAIEVNLSCPNIDCGYETFSTNPHLVGQVIQEIKQVTDLDVWAKLSPNVTDILPMVEACALAQVDAVVMINTLLGLSIDVHKKKPYFDRIFAGYSGPAIKPIALRFVWQTYERFKDIPIIAVGGISQVEDIVEFMLAGASAVQVGTCSFRNPCLITDLIEALPIFVETLGYTQSIQDMVGVAHNQN